MVSSPFHVAFEFFPETKLLNTTNDAKTFTKFGLVLDLESDSVILKRLIFLLERFRRIFILNLLLRWSILPNIISIFIIDLILNHLKIIVIHHVWTNLGQRDIVCFGWRVRTQCILYLADLLFRLFFIHDLVKSVILPKTHSPIWLSFFLFDRWHVALSFKTLLLLVDQGVLGRQVDLRGHFRVLNRLDHRLFIVDVVS